MHQMQRDLHSLLKRYHLSRQEVLVLQHQKRGYPAGRHGSSKLQLSRRFELKARLSSKVLSEVRSLLTPTILIEIIIPALIDVYMAPINPPHIRFQVLLNMWSPALQMLTKRFHAFPYVFSVAAIERLLAEGLGRTVIESSDELQKHRISTLAKWALYGLEMVATQKDDGQLENELKGNLRTMFDRCLHTPNKWTFRIAQQLASLLSDADCNCEERVALLGKFFFRGTEPELTVGMLSAGLGISDDKEEMQCAVANVDELENLVRQLKAKAASRQNQNHPVGLWIPYSSQRWQDTPLGMLSGFQLCHMEVNT
mmetsp:Transcript_23308/g.39095  ORF Transcript_23308/g.39095 Transcript_23308/m.39095 type:complete len:312 (+) Transcript_23308:2313-3248(+)